VRGLEEEGGIGAVTSPLKTGGRAWIRAGLSFITASILLGREGVRADIVECPPDRSGFSVFLSEPAYSKEAFPTPRDMRDFMEDLHFHLAQDRDRHWINSPSTDVKFVLCRGRAPVADGQDFDARLVESMFTHRVLLEIWGKLDVKRETGGRAVPTAQINYLLVPLRYAGNSDGASTAGLQRLRYPDEGAAATADFLQVIAKPLDIDAFVAAALGVRLLREKSWELAHRNLCRSNVLLQQIEKRPLGKSQRKDIVDLRTFVLKSASDAISGARGTPEGAGALRLQDPANPCSGEEQLP
jgi:hypothetical protein